MSLTEKLEDRIEPHRPRAFRYRCEEHGKEIVALTRDRVVSLAEQHEALKH